MINQWFASECDSLIELAANNGVKTWVYGHTHDCNETITNGMKLVCNPIGYPGERAIKVSEDGDTTILLE